MSSVALLAFLLAAEPEPRRLLDDASLAVAAGRCVELGDKLLAEIPESRSKSVRPAAETLAAYARRDLARVYRGGPLSPTDEATVLFNYGELCKLAVDVLGSDAVTFKPSAHKPAFVEDTTRIGLTRINRFSYAQTLQNPDEISAVVAQTKAMYKALRETARRDSLQTARWKRQLAKYQKELNQAAFDLTEPGKLSKAPAEAAIYAAHARAMGLLANSDR